MKSWAKMKEQCLCGIFRQKTENQSLNMKFADKEAKLGIKSLGRKKRKSLYEIFGQRKLGTL